MLVEHYPYEALFPIRGGTVVEVGDFTHLSLHTNTHAYYSCFLFCLLLILTTNS